MTSNGDFAAGRTLQVLAPAKLNLTLEVVGRRADGYHLLQSVMQSIDIADIVTVSVPGSSASGAIVTGTGAAGPNGVSVPNGEGNLAARAVAVLRAALEQPIVLSGLHIQIDKRIPVAAGLGGGSADAAAALIAANELWDLQWSQAELAAIGVQIGADVPFCVHGGTALARGIGEQLTPIQAVETDLWAGVVLNPGFAVSTQDVYRLYSKSTMQGWGVATGGDDTTAYDDGATHGGDVGGSVRTRGLDRAEAMAQALQRGDVAEVGRLLYNALETVTTRLHPEVGNLRRRALRAGAIGTVMCGSGPSVFALARDVEHAAVLAARLAYATPYVAICRFLARGSRLVEAERLA